MKKALDHQRQDRFRDAMDTNQQAHIDNVAVKVVHPSVATYVPQRCIACTRQFRAHGIGRRGKGKVGCTRTCQSRWTTSKQLVSDLLRIDAPVGFSFDSLLDLVLQVPYVGASERSI